MGLVIKMMSENREEGGYVSQQYPQQPQQPQPQQQPPQPMAPQYYPKPKSFEETLASNMMIFIAVFFGFLMIFIGKILFLFTTGDAAKVGSVLIALGAFVMGALLLFAMVMRNDINRWVRVAVILFVIVLTIYLLGTTVVFGIGSAGYP